MDHKVNSQTLKSERDPAASYNRIAIYYIVNADCVQINKLLDDESQ